MSPFPAVPALGVDDAAVVELEEEFARRVVDVDVSLCIFFQRCDI